MIHENRCGVNGAFPARLCPVTAGQSLARAPPYIDDSNCGSDVRNTARLIEEKRREGTFLTVLGFGMGNLKDSNLESWIPHLRRQDPGNRNPSTDAPKRNGPSNPGAVGTRICGVYTGNIKSREGIASFAPSPLFCSRIRTCTSMKRKGLLTAV